MKLKTVYFTIVLIFVVVSLALWKLNENYSAEKISIKQNQLQAQSTALRTTLVSQISQLRNTLSAYTLQIDESKVNWVQLKPFYALATVQENTSGKIDIIKMFLKSGSVAERWNSQLVQQSFKYAPVSNQLLQVQTYKDSDDTVHLAVIVFDKEKRSNLPRSGVMVIGDVSFFQRFFDLQRTNSTIQALLIDNKQVAAHSEYEYVGNTSSESKISEKDNFIDRQEIRGTNLSLLSYATKKAKNNLNIPFSILGIIIGLAFLMSGILLYAVKIDAAPVNENKPEKLLGEVEIPGLGLASVKPEPEIQKTVPLSFDQEPQNMSMLIQICAQQALFNVDTSLKVNNVVVHKEFVSSEVVFIDHHRFTKIFENIFLTVANQMIGSKKKIHLRSYDSDQVTTFEIQCPITDLKLHNLIPPVLKEAHCEFAHVMSSAGESIFRFNFKREIAIQVKELNPEPKADAKAEEDNMEKISQPVQPSVKVDNDLDIDALLSLDTDDEQSDEKQATVKQEKPIVNLEKELKPSKYKLDEKLTIVEDPVIDFAKSTDKLDEVKVKIRRPEKG